MHAKLIAAVVTAGRIASAEPLVSLPIDLGLATRLSAPNGASIGFRPEVIDAFDAGLNRYGVGGYGEAVIARGLPSLEKVFGAGVTGVLYGDMFAIAVSAGGDAVDSSGALHPQLAFSFFFGLRAGEAHRDEPPFETPLGFRLDARPGTSAIPGSVTFSAVVDTVALGVIASEVVAWLRGS
jgi:hypothetical protein